MTIALSDTPRSSRSPSFKATLDELGAEFPSASIVGSPYEDALALLDGRRLSIVIRRPDPSAQSGGAWVTPSGQRFGSVAFAVAVSLGRPCETMRRAGSRPALEVGADAIDYFERLRVACAAETSLVILPAPEGTDPPPVG